MLDHGQDGFEIHKQNRYVYNKMVKLKERGGIKIEIKYGLYLK